MRVVGVRGASVGAALVLALIGCGSTESGSPEPAEGGNAGDSSPSSEGPSVAGEEQITPGGIAVIVRQRLGPDAIRKFFVFESEPGSVVVFVRLRDATPHNFFVQVYPPEQAERSGTGGRCPREPESERETQCRTLDNGTTVTTRVDDEGFSDDNEDGMVVSATAVTPEDGGASAWFESYDDSPAVSVTDLEDLLTDPRLTWLTDPAVNEAGKDLDIMFID